MDWVSEINATLDYELVAAVSDQANYGNWQ